MSSNSSRTTRNAKVTRVPEEREGSDMENIVLPEVLAPNIPWITVSVGSDPNAAILSDDDWRAG